MSKQKTRTKRKSKSRNEAKWIARDYVKCSGCRKCEIACSLYHEAKIWPEASRIRVFMLIPGSEFPHLCVQCHDYNCVNACPFDALLTNEKTGGVIVDEERCIGCGKCILACPGRIPHMHPKEKRIVICDLCDGDPQCVKVCKQGGWNALKTVKRGNSSYKLYARRPEEVTKELAVKLYGENGEEFV